MNTPPLRLEVCVERQSLRVLQGRKTVRRFPVSTSAQGTGFEAGSHRTPTGRFAISDKIGSGAPLGTIFVSREPVGIWSPGEATPKDLVLTRILRLDGLDPENRNTRDRYIYFHGTNQEEKIGQPASMGCIRLTNADMIELFDLVEVGTKVRILNSETRRPT